jgi:MFS family permease
MTATTLTAAKHDRPPIELPHRTRMEILVAVLLGIFLAALDQTIVGTALPRIVTDLQGNDVYTWAFTSYLVTATVSGPIYGKLSDIFGRRPIFLIGVGVFLLGSILAGISGDMVQFIAFRGLQGLGAGALFPVALSIIGDIFAPSERGKYQGFFGAVFGLSSLIGPALGGLITDNFGWHWIFYVNVPIGAVVLFVIWRTLPTHHEPDADRHIDYLGAAVFVAALVPILIGFTNKQGAEWTDPQVGGLIGLGLFLAAVFVWVESRAKEPILPLELFRMRAFTASVIAIFLAAMGFFAVIVFLPRWYQVVAGASATESGYQILPLLFGLIVSAVGAGQLVARTGRYKALILGALLLLAVDGGGRPGYRAFIRGLHPGGPERGAGAGAGLGNQQRDPLPAGGRHRRPGDRGVHLRFRLPGRGAAAADGQRRTRAVRERLRAGRDGVAQRARRSGRPGSVDPRPGAGAAPSAGGATDPRDRGWHLPGLLAGHGRDVRARDRERHPGRSRGAGRPPRRTDGGAGWRTAGAAK